MRARPLSLAICSRGRDVGSWCVFAPCGGQEGVEEMEFCVFAPPKRRCFKRQVSQQAGSLACHGEAVSRPSNHDALAQVKRRVLSPPGCARRETRASNVAMSFAKECHGITHRYIRSSKTQNALPESKREFPPYPSVASDGGDENAPSHPGYSSKTIPRERCYTTAGAVLGGPVFEYLQHPQ